MPELPDLEIIRDFLASRVVGTRIDEVLVPRPLVVRDLVGRDLGSVVGCAIVHIDRRGKYLIFAIDSDDLLVVNPMLAGRFHYLPCGERLAARTFFVLRFADKMDLRYTDTRTMGKVYLVRDLALVPGMTSQGPEALDPNLTLDVFRERLRHYRGEIKGVLTNQEFVAGIGSAYADEILFRAGIYPFRKCTTLSSAEIAQLYQAMRSVLAEAIAMLHRRVGDDIGTEVRDFLAVHNRGDVPCPRCGTPLSEITARQRITTFCRRCQPGTLVEAMRRR
jgi:formamidopyrimidine-DNA glycosylase